VAEAATAREQTEVAEVVVAAAEQTAAEQTAVEQTAATGALGEKAVAAVPVKGKEHSEAVREEAEATVMEERLVDAPVDLVAQTRAQS
jgi:hypothetical protein